MDNILETIAEKTKERVREEKKRVPLAEVRAAAEARAAVETEAAAAVKTVAETGAAAGAKAAGATRTTATAGVMAATGTAAATAMAATETAAMAAAATGTAAAAATAAATATGTGTTATATTAAATDGSPSGHRFEAALRAPGISFICEVKKASPSKGVIAGHFPYLSIAREYEEAGAAAISCLTEPYWFLGRDEYLKEITDTVQIPVLRKDFTVDEYMIYQAKNLGASAVLLICAILDDGQLRSYLELSRELKLDALVEAHTEAEVARAVKAKASVIGVNNRDLRTFHVDLNTGRRLRELVPNETVFVSESGIRTAEDIELLYRNGTDAVLIGETLMRSPDKKKRLEELRRLIGGNCT